MSTILIVLLIAFAAFLVVGVMLSRGRGGWRARARDVASPSPTADGDAVRSADSGGPDPLTPRGERETTQREISY